LELYNIAGQKVKFSATQNISSQGLSKGLYILRVISETGKIESLKLLLNNLIKIRACDKQALKS
jgi:hypothetical protein